MRDNRGLNGGQLRLGVVVIRQAANRGKDKGGSNRCGNRNDCAKRG